MIRLFFIVVPFLASAVAFAQLPNPSGQLWREYPVGSICPPNIIASLSPTPELPMKPPTILDFIKRESDETTWIGPNFGMVGTDGQKLFVYHTPAVQQRVAETVGRFLRPETQQLRFVLTARFVTISDNALAERLADAQGKTPDFVDMRTPVMQYLHPISGPDGKPRPFPEGTSAYWVAREDAPKMYEKWSELFGVALGETQPPLSPYQQLTTFNGQLGAILDLLATPFTTATTLVDGQRRPVVTTIHEGATISGFSLLSWDGGTVDSDIFVEFSKVMRVERSAPLPESEISIETPHLEKLTLAEQGLRWPTDAMLVVIMGTKRLSEGNREFQMPVYSKIPFINRWLLKKRPIGRETQRIYTIITIRQAEASERTATVPFPRIPIR